METYNFAEAIAELVRRHPEAQLGLSVTSPDNQYYARADGRTYRAISDSDVFVSTDERKRMYVYFDNGGIYAGDKDDPHFNNL